MDKTIGENRIKLKNICYSLAMRDFIPDLYSNNKSPSECVEYYFFIKF